MKDKQVWTCYYCGQKFDKNTKLSKHELTCVDNPKFVEFPYNSNPRTAWLVLWIITMMVFVVYVLLIPTFSSRGQSIFQMGLFFGNIGLGIIAFFAMFISKNKPKNRKIQSILKYSLFICFAYMIINPLVFAMEGNRNKNNVNPKTSTKFPIKVTPTSIKDNIVPTKSEDLVNCSISKECGGGTKILKRSICSASTCCEISGKGWIFYQSKSACIRDQNTAISQKYGQNQVSTPTRTPGLSMEEYNRQLALIKIRCNSTMEPYTYDFGELTYSECTQKTNAYFEQKRKELGPTPEPGHLGKALQEMYDISHPTYAPIVIPTIDGTIHMEISPTSGVPFGFSN